MLTAKEYLHSDGLLEDDTIFDPPVKCEYSEEQIIRFAELWVIKNEENNLNK